MRGSRSSFSRAGTGSALSAARARRRSAGVLRAVLAGFLLVCGAGCLLSTRDGENPDGGNGGAVWVQPGTLGNALGNMRRSLEAKSLTNYGNSFNEENFEMLLDPADESELGYNEFEQWSALQEEQRMSGILNSVAAELAVFWTPDDSLNGETSSVRYYRDLSYRLEFSESTRSVTYSGKADVWFEDNGAGLWFITKWVDKRDGSANRTWGWLRARSQVEFP